MVCITREAVARMYGRCRAPYQHSIRQDALQVGCKPSDAPAGGTAFVDGVRASATDFQSVFPYLNTPLPGAR